MSDKIAVIDRRGDIAHAEPAAPADHSPGALLRLAIDRDLPIEKLQQLMGLQERWEANEARKAYVAAMGDLKRDDCPVIVKDQTVSYKNTRYDHSSLAHVVSQCVAALAKHGFHHEWETAQDKGTVEVSCIVTHRQGHSTRKTLTAPHDTSGSKNAIQAIASTVTYLQRYTLLMALGLAPADDDDGRAAGVPVSTRAEKPAQEQPSQSASSLPPRAAHAIRVWSKYLGRGARADMERLTGSPADGWGEQDYGTLMDAWQVVRAAETPDAKTAALRAEIEKRAAAKDG